MFPAMQTTVEPSDPFADSLTTVKERLSASSEIVQSNVPTDWLLNTFSTELSELDLFTQINP